MGTIKRHPGAPYTAGEMLDGTEDLEHDISTFYSEFNGKITDANIFSAANINGTQTSDTGFVGGKFLDRTVTTSSMAQRAFLATDGTNDAMTTSATFVDVPNIATITVTPNATGDLVVATFSFTWSGGAPDAYVFSFSVGGNLGGLYYSKSNFSGHASGTLTWSQDAGVASPTTLAIKPIYLLDSGTGASAKFTSSLASTVTVGKIFSVYLAPS